MTSRVKKPRPSRAVAARDESLARTLREARERAGDLRNAEVRVALERAITMGSNAFVGAVAWTMTEVPNTDLPDLMDRIYPKELELSRARDNSVVFAVKRPIAGLEYGVGWWLP